jgi:hypothetical protein
MSFPGWLAPIIGPIAGCYVLRSALWDSEVPAVVMMLAGAAMGLVGGIIVFLIDRKKSK